MQIHADIGYSDKQVAYVLRVASILAADSVCELDVQSTRGRLVIVHEYAWVSCIRRLNRTKPTV
jgi:hypothetical protein